MPGRFPQENRIDSIISTISSATSAPYWVSMENADEVSFIVSMGTAVGGLQSALSVLQSANTTGAGAAITGATAVIGSTASTVISNAKRVLITISSASTDNDLVQLNGTTYTQSTSNVATSLQFGSTQGTTSAAGLDDIANALSSRINTQQGAKFTATTASTASVRISLDDTASTGVINLNISANHIPSYEMAQAVISVKAEDLNSTSKYVALQLGTVATAVRANVTIIRSNYRYSPDILGSPVTITS